MDLATQSAIDDYLACPDPEWDASLLTSGECHCESCHTLIGVLCYMTQV